MELDQVGGQIYSMQPVLWAVDALSEDFESLRRPAQAARALLAFQNPRIEPVYVMKKSQELFDIELLGVECNELFPTGEENLTRLVDGTRLSNLARPLFLPSKGNSKAAVAQALIDHAMNRNARMIVLNAGQQRRAIFSWRSSFFDLVVERSPIPVLLGNETVSPKSRIKKALFVTDFSKSDLRFFGSLVVLAREQRFDIAVYYRRNDEECSILAAEWNQFAHDQGVNSELIQSRMSIESLGELTWSARKHACELIALAVHGPFWRAKSKRRLLRHLVRYSNCSVLVQNPQKI
jgi:hypothetical protein